MRLKVKKICVTLSFFVAFSYVGQSRASDIPPVTDASKIRWIEGYFNQLKTLRANFTQQNPDGSESHGTFYLSRPGRMRIQYAEPDKRLMVADGVYFFYADPVNDEVSKIMLPVSPAYIILKEHVSFTEDSFRITQFSDYGKKVELTVINDDEPEYGSLTLIFDKNPFQLSRWEITSPSGQRTTVDLTNIKKGIELSKTLFDFQG